MGLISILFTNWAEKSRLSWESNPGLLVGSKYASSVLRSSQVVILNWQHLVSFQGKRAWELMRNPFMTIKVTCKFLLIIITFLLGGSELSLRSSLSLHCSTSTSSSSSTSSSTSSSSVEWRLSEWRFVDGGDAEDRIATSPSRSDFVEKFRPGWKYKI